MVETFYSRYVKHCMHFYARYRKPEYFRTTADKKNWQACDNAIKEFSPEEKERLLALYNHGDITTNAFKVAKKDNITMNEVWKLVATLEYKVAKKRGLI
jgi:hypothetical protein